MAASVLLGFVGLHIAASVLAAAALALYASDRQMQRWVVQTEAR